MSGPVEFQVVVMAAGKGSRMSEVTASRPRCLIPVANYPLLWYPLSMLQRNGFQEVIVVVPESAQSEVAALPKKYSLALKLDVVPISTNTDWGTADSLRHVQDRIKTDVIVVSCDLIADINLAEVVLPRRIHGASVTAVYSKVDLHLNKVQVPGPKTKHKNERDLVGIDQNSSRLVYLTSEADIEDETVYIKRSVLRRYPHVRFQTGLLDAHLYVLAKWVCDYLAQNQSITALKGELMPYLVRKQFSKPKVESPSKPTVASLVSESFVSDIFSFSKEDERAVRIREASSWTDHSGDMDGAYHSEQIRCYAHVVQSKCLRANTLPAYCEANRLVSKDWVDVIEGGVLRLIHPSSQVMSTQIGPDCCVGESTIIAAKTSIKRCIIGSHCKIEEKVRLTNCILMDNVVVKEGSVLQGCLVCANANVHELCDLKDCLVGGNHTVHSGTRSSNEILVDVDRMMEI